MSLIASAGVGILLMAFWTDGVVSFANTDLVAVVIFAAAFIALRIFKKKLNPIYVILSSGAVGILVYSLLGA